MADRLYGRFTPAPEELSGWPPVEEARDREEAALRVGAMV